MTRRKGSKDAPGAGGAMAGAGAPKGSRGGEREGAGAKAGTSNHMLPKTKAKKLVDDGLLLDRDGLYREALAKFQEAIEVDPENGHAYLCASKLMWRVTKGTRGFITAAEMQQCLSYAEESWRLGCKAGEAQTMFMRLAGPEGRGDILREHMPALLVYYKATSEQESIKLLAGSAGIEARQVSVTYGLYGIVLHEAKENDLAIAADRKAMELDPENWIVLSNLGRCLQEAGRLAEALETTRAALRLRPAFEPLKSQLEEIQEMQLIETQGAALIIAGRLPEALETVRAALRIWPTSELHKRKLVEIQEMQLKEIQIAAAAAAERAAYDEKVAAAAASLRAAYDDRFYPERAAFDDDVFQVAAAAAVERVFQVAAAAAVERVGYGDKFFQSSIKGQMGIQ
jgi:tetratricopeptide (TPR) repeat protein